MNLILDYFDPFVNSAGTKLNFNDYINYAIAAIGVNLIWALIESEAITWSVFLTKKTFSLVAKRMLGPVGFAITVASFGFFIVLVKMNSIFIISVLIIIYALYKNGREVYNSIIARDNSRLKATLFFFFLTIAVSVGQLFLIQRFS